jgi:hypothetical protein
MTEWDLAYMRLKVRPSDAELDRIADAVPIDPLGVHITTWHRRFARAVLAAQPAPVPAAKCDGGTCGAGGYRKDCPKRPAPVPAVPPGWKLVPVEPTPEMEDAMVRVGQYHATKLYRAAIAASPEVPK